MRVLYFLLITCSLFIACEKSDDGTENPSQPAVVQGTYTGYFVRSGMDTAKVGISFNDRGRYEGTSTKPNYPAICKGSFTVNENTITFGDSCTWRADFDWSLILDGTYNISYPKANSIRIYKTTGAVTDEYVLSK